MCVSVDDDYRERIIDRLSATGEREGGGGLHTTAHHDDDETGASAGLAGEPHT